MAGKSVLFICPAFRGLHKDIALKLDQLGYAVKAYTDYPESKLFIKLASYYILRIKLIKVLEVLQYLYSQKILREVNSIKFDIVIVVKGSYFPGSFYHKLRLKNPDARFIMYQWDSNKAFKFTLKRDFLNYIRHFDVVYTFDRKDAEEIKELKYLPLFYKDEFSQLPENKELEYEYDLFFIGGAHSDRNNILEKIYKNLKDQGIRFCFIILDISVTNHIDKNGFRNINTPLPYTEVIQLLRKSKVVIDIQSDLQTGLTIRTFETLGSGKKLATSNTWISKEPFYSPDDIWIFDINNPVIPLEFITSPIMKKDYSAYSLESFVHKLTGS